MNKKKEEEKNENNIDVNQSLLHQRRLFLYEDISEKSARKIVQLLYVLDMENNNPIQLRINSPGGSISAGLSIIDAMKDIKSPIITYISGEACSMGAMISICGDERIMTQNSIWMAHPPSGGVSADYFKFEKDRMKMIELVEKTCIKLLKKYTKLSDKEIQQTFEGELWFNATTCRKKGIIDKVKRL